MRLGVDPLAETVRATTAAVREPFEAERVDTNRKDSEP